MLRNCNKIDTNCHLSTVSNSCVKAPVSPPSSGPRHTEPNVISRIWVEDLSSQEVHVEWPVNVDCDPMVSSHNERGTINPHKWAESSRFLCSTLILSLHTCVQLVQCQTGLANILQLRLFHHHTAGVARKSFVTISCCQLLLWPVI